MQIEITPIAADDLDWCARLMAGNEPWISLGRDYAACRDALSHPSKERYIVRADGERAGLLILDLTGPFPGYIQTICVAEDARGQGLGSKVIAWAEDRIFRESPNVFICVTSFNRDAQRLYARLGYEHIGTLKGFIVDEHDELLLRKTRGSWEWYRAQPARTPSGS